MIEVEGIILTSQDYRETSKIINVITKEYGIISMIAKGCKSIKSNLRSATDKLTYGKFYVYYKKDKLSILSNVDIIDNFKSIKKDITFFCVNFIFVQKLRTTCEINIIIFFVF